MLCPHISKLTETIEMQTRTFLRKLPQKKKLFFYKNTVEDERLE